MKLINLKQWYYNQTGSEFGLKLSKFRSHRYDETDMISIDECVEKNLTFCANGGTYRSVTMQQYHTTSLQNNVSSLSTSFLRPDRNIARSHELCGLILSSVRQLNLIR